jgi:hypothetical protein
MMEVRVVVKLIMIANDDNDLPDSLILSSVFL